MDTQNLHGNSTATDPQHILSSIDVNYSLNTNILQPQVYAPNPQIPLVPVDVRNPPFHLLPSNVIVIPLGQCPVSYSPSAFFSAPQPSNIQSSPGDITTPTPSFQYLFHIDTTNPPLAPTLQVPETTSTVPPHAPPSTSTPLASYSIPIQQLAPLPPSSIPIPVSTPTSVSSLSSISPSSIPNQTLLLHLQNLAHNPLQPFITPHNALPQPCYCYPQCPTTPTHRPAPPTHGPVRNAMPKHYNMDPKPRPSNHTAAFQHAFHELVREHDATEKWRKYRRDCGCTIARAPCPRGFIRFCEMMGGEFMELLKENKFQRQGSRTACKCGDINL